MWFAPPGGENISPPLWHGFFFAALSVQKNPAPAGEGAGTHHFFGACKYILQAQFSNMFWGADANLVARLCRALI